MESPSRLLFLGIFCPGKMVQDEGKALRNHKEANQLVYLDAVLAGLNYEAKWLELDCVVLQSL